MHSRLQLLRAQRSQLRPYVCPRCQSQRTFSGSAATQSGHNKWSTIKHDKGKNDAAKNRQRSIFSHEIAQASKLFGGDPDKNPRLALAVATAKKAGTPKSLIESAIARGQGVSASGAALENITIEGILPPSVALVIDCQTDNKLRTLADVKYLIKQAGGSATPTSYLFERKGRIIYKQKDGVGQDEVLEPALDAGAVDVVEGPDGGVAVFTEPNNTKAVAEKLASELGLEIEETEIIWDPNEDTMAPLQNDDTTHKLVDLADKLQDVQGVQGLYTNAAQGSLDHASWADIQSRVAL